MKKVFFTLLLLLSLPTLSWASFNSAMDSFERQDYIAASQEFKKLAMQSDKDAQYMLGYMYALGKGVLQDYVEAHKWFNIAASLGNTEAIKARKEVERKMTSEQIYQAQTQARSWQPGQYKKPVLTAGELDSKAQKNEAVPKQADIRDKETIRRVQSKLSSLGYQAGAADGMMGNKTRIAIRQYQYDNNLSEDGRVTQTLINVLFPGGITSKKTSHTASKEFLFPEIWANSGSTTEASLDKNQILEQLNQLLKRGQQERAAQQWFLNELSELIGQNQSDWPTILLSDNFKDGDYIHKPEWSVLSGQFTVTEQGLKSQIHRAQKDSISKSSEQALSTAILGVIIDHTTKKTQTSDQVNKDTTSGMARIVTKKSIPNRFSLMTKLSLHSTDGRIEFGPFSGQQQRGYQLLISPKDNLIELLRVDGQRSAVIDSVHKKIVLDKPHTIEWIRDSNGEMTVAMNGKQLFKIVDRQHKENFSGFMLNNFMSSLTLHEVTILGK